MTRAAFIELILCELGKKLAQLFMHPSPQGQKVIIHIAKDRRQVWIEMPPEIVSLADD